jgi:hypothetical protein
MIRTFSSDSIERVARAVRRVERMPLGGVVRRGKLAEGGSGLDLSKVALGYEINPDGDDPDEVEIKAGEIDRVAVDAAKVVVADDDYIYVRHTIADDTMLVAAAASVPANDATYRYYRLYRFTVTGEGDDATASIQNIYRPFDIEGVVVANPPETGTYFLMSIDGAVQWVEGEEFSCPS